MTVTQPHGLSRYLVYLPITLLLLLALGWWAYWSVVAGRVVERAEAFAAAQAARGVTVGWDRLEIDGFPLHMVARLDGPRASGDGWSWRAPAMTVDVRPYALGHAIVRLEGPQDIRWRGAVMQLETAAAAASVIAQDGALARVDVDLRGPHLTGRDAQGAPVDATAHRAQIHVRQAGSPDAHDVVLSLADAAVRGGARLLMGPEIAELRLEGRLTAAPALQAGALREAARAWAEAGGALEVSNAVLRWGALDATGSGTLALDRELRPAGRIAARIGGYPELLAALEAQGTLDADRRALGGTVMTALAAIAGDAQGRAPVDVAMADGVLWLGPAPAARLEPLF